MTPITLIPITITALALPAFAQWTSDPLVNTLISGAASDQNQPKVAPTDDGGCYITWLDGLATGWDTQLQRLDSHGVAQWPGAGIVVADTSFSSTEDYGLAVDADGHAIIAYRDNSSGVTRIEVQKVNTDGTLAWNPLGVLVSAGNSTSFSPRVCVASDGAIVVAWTQDNGVRLQRLNADGVPQWQAGGILDAPPAGFFLLADLQPGDGGSVIASYIRFAALHLHAQKFDRTGAKLWNAGNALVVFDGTSLANGYQPPFLPDGAGGAAFGWYDLAAAGPGNVRVQRVSAAGVEQFPHNGVVAATNTAGIGRSNPSISLDPASGDIYGFWSDVTLPLQNQWGVSGQRFSATGQRLWGDGAITILPFSAMQNSFIRTLALSGGGAMAYCFDQAGPAAHVIGWRADADGTLVWSKGFLDVCAVDSGKARLMARLDSDGATALLAWSDARDDGGDIYAQNVNLDGSLGVPADLDDDGFTNGADLGILLLAWSACPEGGNECPADLTGDGTVDGADLGILLLAWTI